MLRRQESKEFPMQENERKRKIDDNSPRSITETVSRSNTPTSMDTPTPRKFTLQTPEQVNQQLSDYRSGKDANIHPFIKDLEDERKHIHHSLVGTWDKYPEQRKRLRERSDIIKRLEKDELERRQKEQENFKMRQQEIRKKAYETYIASLHPIDRPSMTKGYIHIEDFDKLNEQYADEDAKTHAEMEKEGLAFGGKKRKTRKNKQIKNHAKKSVKKSKKSRKTRKTKKGKVRAIKSRKQYRSKRH